MSNGAARYAWDMLHSEIMHLTENLHGNRNSNQNKAEMERFEVLMKLAREEAREDPDFANDPDRALIVYLAHVAATLLITVAAVVNKRLAELDPDAEQVDLLETMVQLGEVIGE
jgi:hypothetical protein